MSQLRSLLFLVVVVCAAPLCAADWPCPDASYLYPCTCTADVSYEITMDCSNAKTSQELRDAFETPFPFNDLKRLIIQPSSAISTLIDLPAGVFGPVSFEEIDITNTKIETVEEEAMVNSHNTLVRLNMARNLINSFPFETLDLYVFLEYIDLSDNQFSGVIPDIVTEALISLDLSGNTDFTLTETVFTGSSKLQVLRLNDMGLGDTTPPNVFKELSNLRTLDLQSNGISGTLIESFINTDSKTLTDVNLDGNLLSQIHPLSLTGLSSSGRISFLNNQIEYLTEDNWRQITSQLIGTELIDMRYNPLVCGCDLIWLLQDSSALGLFNKQTMCEYGILLIDVPLDGLISKCP